MSCSCPVAFIGCLHGALRRYDVWNAARSRPRKSPIASIVDVGRRMRGDLLRVERVVALPGKHRRHPAAPDLLHRIQDAQLVVDQHVVLGRIEPRDVVQLVLLVDVDQHAVLERAPQARALHLARLEHRVAVRQDHRRAPVPRVSSRHRARRDRGGRRTDSPTSQLEIRSRRGSCSPRPGSAAARRDSRRSRVRSAAPRTDRPVAVARHQRRTRRADAGRDRPACGRCRAACCPRRTGTRCRARRRLGRWSCGLLRRLGIEPRPVGADQFARPRPGPSCRARRDRAASRCPAPGRRCATALDEVLRANSSPLPRIASPSSRW